MKTTRNGKKDGQKIQLSYNNFIAGANGDLDGGTSHFAYSGSPRL